MQLYYLLVVVVVSDGKVVIHGRCNICYYMSSK